MVTEKPCCFPEQYQGILGMVTQTLGHRPSKIGTMANFSIDYKNEKIAVYEQIHAHRHTMNMSLFMDFKAKKQYTVFWEKKWCCALNMSQVMQPRCALNNATFMGSAYFGVGASALATTAWGIHVCKPGLKVSAEIVVTQKNCIPFNQIVMGRSHFTPFLQIVSYYNNTLGIQDPGVFTPPDFCKKEAQDCGQTMELPAATQHIVDFVTVKSENPGMKDAPLETNEVLTEDGASDLKL